jgi:magnesium chelatase family protein
MEAKKIGITTFIVPKENEQEGNLVDGVKIHSFSMIKDVYSFLFAPKDNCKEKDDKNKGKVNNENNRKESNMDNNNGGNEGYKKTVDFRDIFGQKAVKRAVEIAVAGGHNVLLIGPPGSGKSLIAQAIPSILPTLKNNEMLEITKIYSIMGLLQEGNPLITLPPFRSVHHTTTRASMVGGGVVPRIGEITLAHKGILYLDELPEFSRTVIEVLRQPLEDKSIEITRTTGSYCFPANFILVCAMNPCPCGMYPDLERCNCSPTQITKYLGKVSQPFLDRIDICIEVPRLKYTDLNKKGDEESSAKVRERVVKTRERQYLRNQNKFTNSNLTTKEVQKYCALDKKGEELMEQAYHKLNLTARSYHKILKVARTIGDIGESDIILPEHLREAIAYRTLDKKYWRCS